MSQLTAITSEPPDFNALDARDRNVHSFVALMYHNVIADGLPSRDISPAAATYFVTRSAFEMQLKLVSAHSAGCMKSEMLQSFFTPGFASNNREDLRGVLLTFDDGWSAAIDEAGPLLEHHGWQATVFVTIDLLDRPHFLGRAALARLNPRVFRIGSHAMTHRMLSLLCEKEIKAELGDSKKQLEDLAGYEIDMLSIPNGAVDQRVRDVAAECGYRFVFDSHVAVERRGFNALSIGRVAIKQNTPIEAFTRFLATGLARERMLRGLLGVPKNVLGLRRYEMLRKWVFERSAADGNDGGELNALS